MPDVKSLTIGHPYSVIQNCLNYAGCKVGKHIHTMYKTNGTALTMRDVKGHELRVVTMCIGELP